MTTISYSLFALGFRPFYLAGALFAVLALPLWLAMLFGFVQMGGYLNGMPWHSHEMVFGFTSAVIAGFLLTAVRNWTNLPTPHGLGLAALTCLWLLARGLLLTDFAVPAVITDLAFLPVLAGVIAVPIWRSRNLRNLKLLVVLGGLSIANALFHLAQLGLLAPVWRGASVTLALDLITILMAIIGGRVIPAFTINAVPSARPVRSTFIEVTAVGSLVGILMLDALAPWFTLGDGVWVAALLIAALANIIRWLLWKPHRTLGNALLWMLPAAYGWIPVSLAIRAFSMLGAVPPVAAVHALTLGAISALMIAMMMRSSLGHTGRALRAGVAEVSAFLLVQFAAVVRVGGMFVEPGLYRSSVMVSGALWSLGFAVFVFHYGPMLIRPRVDEQPGRVRAA